MKIQQHTTRLYQLVRDVSSGVLMPAAFQRPYVWTRADALSLFESILMGYPVGSFLVWSPYGKVDMSKASRQRLGPIEVNDSTSATTMVLDGQNRLATMAWFAREPGTPVPEGLTAHEQEVWGGTDQLVLDCVAQKLMWVPAEEAEAGIRLPACSVLDSRVCNRIVRKYWDTLWAKYSDEEKNDALRFLDKCSNAFMDAQVVVTNLEHATAEEAKNAFMHICKVGVPMSEQDFDAAVAWASKA